MPAVNPKSLPVNLRRNSPARSMTPQEMRTAVAELKNKAPAPSTKPPIGAPKNPGGPSMGLGSTPPGSAQPSMGPAPTMRTPVRPTSPERMMKKGGQAKAYASGGTVRGSGIAQRGVKKCKIY